MDRYEDEGLDGLPDKRLGQAPAERASVDEVVRTETLYRERYQGWNAKHFHEEFAVPAAEPGCAFVPFAGPGLPDVLCEHHERAVGRDDCVSFQGKRLQPPARTCRCPFIKVRGRVHRYPRAAKPDRSICRQHGSSPGRCS